MGQVERSYPASGRGMGMKIEVRPSGLTSVKGGYESLDVIFCQMRIGVEAL